MSKTNFKNLIRIIIALIMFFSVFITDKIIDLSSVFAPSSYAFTFTLSLYLFIFLFIGYDIIHKSFRNILRGQVFDENFLMCIAAIGAFAIQEYAEGVAVILFYQIGEFFQNYAVNKSRKSISELMDIRPTYANLIKSNKEIVKVSPSIVKIGDKILVKPGERIPLDGIIIKGSSSLDTASLTGESLPREVKEKDEVLSGSININGTIEIAATKAYRDSTVSKILDLVENAVTKKSPAENFITKFAKWYTPSVVISALLLALIGGAASGEWLIWVKRSLNFLVISCPCALVISVPLSFFAGIGVASKNGILIKGSNYMEKFASANIFVFDKTGTLTKGNFAVCKISPSENKDEILRLAAIAESNSNHPIALSIVKAYGKKNNENYEIQDISGKGIIATKDDETILCGNEDLLKEHNIEITKENDIGTIIYVAKNNKYIGSIIISDEIKDNSASAIKYLNSIGAKTIMLTGDNEAIASSVANKIGISEYKAHLLPQDKVKEVSKLLKSKDKKDVLCFIGDGINDAPVLMQADIGIAMGGVGQDSAIEASDIILMHDDLTSLKTTKKISRKVMTLVKENIYFALGIKLLILILSIFGLASMWLAVFADVGVSFLAILNSLRSNTKRYLKN